MLGIHILDFGQNVRKEKFYNYYVHGKKDLLVTSYLSVCYADPGGFHCRAFRIIMAGNIVLLFVLFSSDYLFQYYFFKIITIILQIRDFCIRRPALHYSFIMTLYISILLESI
jgi:hypothetical protein